VVQTKINLSLGLTRSIINVARQRGVLRNQLAYVLATAYWESGRTMQPVREYGGETYLRSKKYYPYVGMGLVQLTWKYNYELASRKLGVDFVSDPRKLLEPGHAINVLVVGMQEGWFTGKKLSDYITLSKSLYVAARRIVNGTDKAQEIADLAKLYEAALIAIDYGAVDNTVPVQPPVVVAPEEPPVYTPTVWERLKAFLSRLFKQGE
jgi:hypothetical protein